METLMQTIRDYVFTETKGTAKIFTSHGSFSPRSWRTWRKSLNFIPSPRACSHFPFHLAFRANTTASPAVV